MIGKILSGEAVRVLRFLGIRILDEQVGQDADRCMGIPAIVTCVLGLVPVSWPLRFPSNSLGKRVFVVVGTAVDAEPVDAFQVATIGAVIAVTIAGAGVGSELQQFADVSLAEVFCEGGRVPAVGFHDACRLQHGREDAGLDFGLVAARTERSARVCIAESVRTGARGRGRGRVGGCACG